jgi:xylulose-5-phosphate/fructose-6-phosphate phosphoketolase
MVTISIEPPADLSAFGKARASVQGSSLTGEELSEMDYWRASLYLSLGMIYLRDNPV